MMNGFWIWLLTFAFQVIAGTIADLPIVQVRLEGTTPLYADPDGADNDDDPVTWRGQGAVLLIFEVDGDWGRSEEGWVSLDELTLEPAIVAYSAEPDGILRLRLAPEIGAAGEDFVPRNALAVVATIDGAWALVYTQDAVGWAQLDDLIIRDMTPAIRDFVEQVGYVKREAISLYADPDADSGIITDLLLGKRVEVLHQQDEWALLRVAGWLGWASLDDLDLLPSVVARGTLTTGPVNLRNAPETGGVVSGLGFNEQVGVLGRNAAGDWLYIRQANGRQGWVFAEFVALTDPLDAPLMLMDLPILPEPE